MVEMSTPRWFYAENENRLGPVAIEQIAHLIMNGGLQRSALVWRHGLTDWTEAGRVPEIASLLPPPLPAGKAARPGPETAPPPVEVVASVDPDAARFDELRRKLETEANPRRYAQVAEDLRKEGEYAEAIRICREGLERHAYPSLRLTLGRVLLENGDLVAARAELETVARAAPDNILAQRLLGECRVAMGEPASAPEAPAVTAPVATPAAVATAPPITTPPPIMAPTPVPPPPPIAAPPAAVAAPHISDLPTLDGSAHPGQTLGQRLAAAQKAKRPAAAKAAPVPPPPPEAEVRIEAKSEPAVAIQTEDAGHDIEITEDGEDAPTLAKVAWPSGRLADHEFADLVREVHGRRWTGLLTLNHMGVEKTVRIQDGRLVFASSSSADDRLGELLLRRGRISLDQFVEAGRGIRKGKRLGTVLVEMGALEAKELVKVVVDHTQEIIYGAFQWTEGHYHLTETTDPAEPIVLKLSTPDIILEGIRRIDRWSRIERAVGTLETRYERVDGYEAVLRQMTLSPDKLALLSGLSGVQDLGTICRRSTIPHFDVCRTMWAFRVIGVVRRLD
jgi:tetratricopeptide (TPR) repeat protein